MRKLFIFLKNIWIILGITLLMLVLIEAGFSVYYHFHQTQDSRVTADCYSGADWVAKYYEEFNECSVEHWTPYVYWSRNPYTGNYINIDDDGLRRTVFKTDSKVKVKKQLRIFMFGGSTLWGTGARDEFTIPSLVGSELSEKGFNVEVLNFGETGYVNSQELIRFYTELRKNNLPDLVVFYDGVNDVFSAYQQGIAGNPQNEFNREREFNATKGKKKSSRVLIESLMTLSSARFLTGLIKREIKIKQYTEQETDELAGETSAIYFENVKLISSLEPEYGFKTLFYWQPIIFNKQSLTRYEQQEIEKVDYIKQFAATVREKIRENLISGYSGKVQDISDIFKNLKEPVFTDFCHISEYGNSLVAQRIATDIEIALNNQEN
jgi:lysophospholipase L1-like esterase